MATARITLGSILGTVNTAAATMTSTISTASKGIGMLDVYVTEAATKQAKRSTADMESYVDELITEKAEQEAERHLRTLEFCARSDQHKSLYQASFDKYAALLKA